MNKVTYTTYTENTNNALLNNMIGRFDYDTLYSGTKYIVVYWVAGTTNVLGFNTINELPERCVMVSTQELSKLLGVSNMKLTNVQKANNSTIKTGIRVLQNKLLKLGEDIIHEDEIIRLNFTLNTEMSKAKIIVAEGNLVILKGMVKQLTTCMGMLKENLV